MTAFFISDRNLPRSGPLRRLGAAPHPQLRWRFILTSLIFLLYMLLPISVRAQSSRAEYQSKAAFIFHFAQLVDWPPEVSGSLDRPLIFCVADENALNGLLEETVRGKQIALHPVQVRHLLDKDNPRSCDLLFIAGQDKKRTAALLKAVNHSPILTVGESEDFIRQGGMIGFGLQDSRICFDVNLQASRRVNLKISSRLLLLAKSVTGDSKPG